MPWMVCACDKRFYAPPSMMTDAKCDECGKAPMGFIPPVAPEPVGIDPAARATALKAEAARERAINATIIDDPLGGYTIVDRRIVCPKCNDEGYINRHANLPDEPCPLCAAKGAKP